VLGFARWHRPCIFIEVARRGSGRTWSDVSLAIVVGSTAAPLVAYLLVRNLPDSVPGAGCSLLRSRWSLSLSDFSLCCRAARVGSLKRDVLKKRARRSRGCTALKPPIPSCAKSNNRSLRKPAGSRSYGSRDCANALLIGLLLGVFNNWTGWSAMGGYIPMLLEMAGVQQRHVALLQFSLTYLAMAALTVVSSRLIDRVGRRPLWLFASVFMALITAGAGAVFHYELHGWPVLLVILLCALPHGLALGPLPWLMMSEIFPTRVRAKAVALTTTCLWLVIYTAAQLSRC